MCPITEKMIEPASIRNKARTLRKEDSSAGAKRARRKFLQFFPGGFYDETYIDWERAYKWNAHKQWQTLLDESTYRSLMRKGRYAQIAQHAVRIEARTNLLFSFEKMALRDAVKTGAGARSFATGLYDLLHGPGNADERFDRWCAVVAALPRKQTRVLTWPLVTVFGFIAQPDQHIFLKPNVTRLAARAYGFDFHYESKPSAHTYMHFLEFAEKVRQDVKDLRPRDLIDIQSFIWVQGSDEYD
jgi:hypothetical protein